MILGDLGAEVIKVERPGRGDDSRSWGPPWMKEASAYFVSVNRNKKSVAVNLKSEDGAEVVRKFEGVTPLQEPLSVPGTLSKLGLGYEQLKKVAPQLIYTSITGFGQTGPYSKRGGYDPIAAALGGLLHITGPEGGEPCRTGVAMTDLSCGLYATGAIMAALLYRQKTGLGQHIDCNLINTQIAALTHIGSNYLNCGVEAQRYGTGHPSVAPLQAFPTKDDRYLMIGAGNDQLFIEICKRIGLPEMATDERYITNALRVENRKSMISAMSERFAQKTVCEWMEVLEGASFPYGPVNNIQQAFSDPQVVHNEMIQVIEHPTEGTIKVPGPAVKYSELDTVLQRAPPLLGQHTDDVLSSLLNYDEDKIKQLKDKGCVA
ncbi:hypothetical protein NP493_679g01025 [Ridgeia piscesae]|uniref:Uncharacterized protein n=1 Tax=Ridgeia piscesae TaxID=27915 RepID=A0AAD9NMV3_RIDPI|nr:hypothetical protein NP493_679g01025 [Ridgeia piscesae]